MNAATSIVVVTVATAASFRTVPITAPAVVAAGGNLYASLLGLAPVPWATPVTEVHLRRFATKWPPTLGDSPRNDLREFSDGRVGPQGSGHQPSNDATVR